MQIVRLTATVIYYALRDQSDGSYINCWLVDQLVGILCLVFPPMLIRFRQTKTCFDLKHCVISF